MWSCQWWLAKHYSWSEGLIAPTKPDLQTIVDHEKRRIFTVTKFLYFVVSNYKSLLIYVDPCKINMHMATLNVSSSLEYSSHANVTSTMEFLDAISQKLYLNLLRRSKVIQFDINWWVNWSNMRTTSYYVCLSLNGVGFGSTCVEFIVPLSRGIWEVMFQSIKAILEKLVKHKIFLSWWP